LKLLDEQGRLAALRRYGVLDTVREGGFDRITALVRDVLEVPICAISLVDSGRQWFKSIQGWTRPRRRAMSRSARTPS
jgi:hypothetical protein